MLSIMPTHWPWHTNFLSRVLSPLKYTLNCTKIVSSFNKATTVPKLEKEEKLHKVKAMQQVLWILRTLAYEKYFAY